MKRKFTKLMAAFALLTFLVPLTGWGQAPVNTTLWEETWTGGATNATPSAYTFSGTTVYGGATLTYAQSSTNTKLYAEALAGGTSPELLLSKSNQTWTISNIPTGQATGMSLTFLSNRTTFDVTSTTNGITISGNQKSWTITVTGSITNFDLTIKNTGSQNARIDNIVLTVTTAGAGASTVATPSITPNGGSFLDSQEVSISCATDGATIYYTTNGNDPTTSSSVYSAPFTINATTTVKAFAVKSGLDNSAIASATFTKVIPMTVAEARAAIDAGTGTQDVYVTGTVSGIVEAWSTGYSNISFNMSDDGLTTSDQLEAFRCVSTDNADASEVGIGDVVVVHGNLTLYNNTTYEFTSGCQLVSLEHPATIVATPTFNPNGGTFTEAQTVTISCETQGATIYYTTDGTDPDDESTLYEGPITVGESMTVKAIAYDNNDNTSSIASATFTINLPYSGAPYARVNNVSYLTDGANVVFAARFNDNVNQYYAMTASATGKPTGVLFTSATSNDLEVLPAAIVNSESTYCWTVGVTNNGFTFTNANGQVIGYTSGTNFAIDGDNTEWTVALGTSGESAMVPSYEAFTITNFNNNGRGFALNNQHNFGPYAVSNYNSSQAGDYNFFIDIFVQGAVPVVTPSITANNVAIGCDATSGSIAYSITNEPSPAGTMTAAIAEGGTIANLSLGTIANGIVPFTCDANMSGASRTATITLTYTYNRETVTRDVTITQAANPNYVMTIAEVRAQGTGSVITAGIVTSCVGTTGYIQDATAAICVYGEELTVGDEIKVSGALSTYNGLLEITSPEVTILSSGNTVNPELMTIAEVNASTNQGWYVRIEDATVSAIDGKNVTIAQGEDNVVVRFANTDDITFAVSDVISLDGNIGAYNGVQIANPQNVTVQQNTEPSITIADAIVNVPAEGAEDTVLVVYENIDEIVANVYFCDAEGAATSYDWIFAEVDDDNNLYYNIDANDGEARTAYLKVYVGQTYSNFVTINQEAYVAPTFAELPFEFDGGKADIENTDGLYQEGLGGDYSNLPKLRFDGDGDYLLLQFNGVPGTLTFDIKGNTGSGDWAGTFKVQTSEDGVTYTDLATYTELTTTVQHESFSDLGANVRYIKWIFDTKDNGNVALGNIELQPYVVPQEYTLTVSGLSNVELYVFDASNENHAIIEGEGSAQVLNGTTIEISVSAIDGYVLESLMVDDVNVTSQIDETGAYTFTMPDHNISVTATAIEYVAGNFVRISDLNQLTDGCKVIIAARYDEEITDGYYAMKNTLTNNKATGVEFSSQLSGTDEILPATIVNVEDDYYWIVNVTEDGYTFTNAGGDKIGYTSGTNFNMTGNRSDWTIERVMSEETAMVGNYTGFVITNVDTDTRAFAFNGSVFGAYAKTNMSGSGYNFYLDFFVQTENSATITQVTHLVAGINWFSMYIEVDDPIDALDMLKEALGENAIQIESMDETTEYDSEWFGELDDIGITNEQMYLITLITDCTVNLQGDPADPADHFITINPGWNWIGFPCDHELNIADALIDFEAEMEDVLEGRDGYTEFDGEWFGDIETLVPGQGYLYYYNGDTPTRLVFHAESKAKRSTPNNINIEQIGQKRHQLGQKQSNEIVNQINNQIKK